MKVQLLAHTMPVETKDGSPEKIIASAAKLCYSPVSIDELYDGLTDEKAVNFVDMLSTIGHESPIEHVSFTFGIEGVSRAFLAQITRHRMASYSVQSQRYVREGEFQYVTPPEIASDPQANELFVNAIKATQQAYDDIAAKLKEKHTKTFLAQGLPEKEAASKAEKMAIEDARFVLPNACDTKMVVTMNARSLMNFFKHRCCQRAQWEIRSVADEMLKLVCQEAPTLFKNAGPGCVNSGCPEGKMSCGKAAEMKKYYKSLKGIE